MGVFFIQGALIANWFPRIPDVQDKLGLGPAELSLALIGMSVGSFVALTVSGRLVAWLTPRRAILFGSVSYCLLMSVPGWVWNGPSLFLGLFVLGAIYVVTDVAANTEAAGIQASLGRRIMSTCHGFWSLGSMVGALASGGFGQAGIAPGWHLLIVGLVILGPAVALARRLPHASERTIEGARHRPLFSLPTVSMIGLCIFAFGIVLAELATRSWAAVFLRDVTGSSPAETGIGYGAFALCMAVGRFIGDKAAERLGAVIVGRAGALTAILGTIAVATAVNGTVAIIGLALLGAGISVGYPLCRERRGGTRRPSGRGQCRGAGADRVFQFAGRADHGRLRRRGRGPAHRHGDPAADPSHERAARGSLTRQQGVDASRS